MEKLICESHPKSWGDENWIVNNELYCSKILTITHGFRCSMHYHEKKDETFYVLAGLVLLEIGGESEVLRPGACVRVRPGVLHRFTGLSDAKILEVSTQHFEEDSFRTQEGGAAPKPEVLD
jgi:mannose-6-phosphate isomerase-like protein (cupin superfamily)